MLLQCLIVVIEFTEHEVPGNLSCTRYKDFLTAPARCPDLNLLQRVFNELLVGWDQGFDDTRSSSLNVRRSRDRFLVWPLFLIVFLTTLTTFIFVNYSNFGHRLAKILDFFFDGYPFLRHRGFGIYLDTFERISVFLLLVIACLPFLFG